MARGPGRNAGSLFRRPRPKVLLLDWKELLEVKQRSHIIALVGGNKSVSVDKGEFQEKINYI